MKKNYLKLLLVFSLIIGTNFSVKAFDLDEDYYKNAIIVGAHFNSSNKDMYCLGKNAIVQLAPTDGKSDAWYFNQVVGSDGTLIGYNITQDKPNTEGYASTYLRATKKDNDIRLGFENKKPGESFSRDFIFAFEKHENISGVEVYKIKNVGTGKYLKGNFNVGGYTGSVSLSSESSANLWTLTPIELDPKKFYSNPKLSGENSISSFTFRLINPENNTALRTSKDDANYSGGGYKVLMTEANDNDAEQLWHFIPVKGYPGYYYLRNMGNGLYFSGLNSVKASKNSSLSYARCMVYLYYTKDNQNIKIYYYLFGEKKYLLTGNELNILQLIRFDQ